MMALADALHTLLRLPGATYSCVVERDSGRVLGELGRGEAGTGDAEGVVPYSVPRWGTAVAAMFDSTSGDELDDVMITGRRSYHLVRPLGPGAEVLVYLRLDRSRSNLAAARRELAAVRASDGPAAAERSGVPRARDEAAPEARRPAAVPPARMPASLAPPTTPARGLRSTASRTASPPAPAEAAEAAPATPAAGRGATRARGAAGRSAGQSRTRADAASTATRPASSAPGRPSAPSAVPTRRPASDAARQIPLPRRAPGRSAADPGPVRRLDTRSGGAAAETTEQVPEGFAVPAVLGQSWARDPGTLRRLLTGLRRMA